MVFREMAKEMSDIEVHKCMAILIENSVVLSVDRDVIQNAIDVTFRVIGDKNEQECKIALMPNSIEVCEGDVEFRHDGEHLYMQYLVAKGYSEYWQGNFFVED